MNKLSHHFESYDTNGAIPISCHDNKAMTILDGGARASIITKQCWEVWGTIEFMATSSKWDDNNAFSNYKLYQDHYFYLYYKHSFVLWTSRISKTPMKMFLDDPTTLSTHP